MGSEMKWINSNMSRVHARSIGSGFLFGCFLVLLIYFSTYDRYASPYGAIDFGAPSANVSSIPLVEDKVTSEQLESLDKMKHQNKEDGLKKIHQFSSPINDSTKKETIAEVDRSGGEEIGHVKPQKKLICNFADWRSDVCEMEGDVRIHGNLSSIYFVNSFEEKTSVTNEAWQVRPYARKGDTKLMESVRKLTIKSLSGPLDAPICTTNHSMPAVVFAIGGYTGNVYHDFTDVLVPLFITSRRFDGEVQFLISQMHLWWVHKYERVLKKLSNYKVIDLDKEVNVHCYSHAIVGLHSHKDLSIDPSRAPNNYSMVDFTRFMRTAYSLNRDSPISLLENPRTKKPRLLIIARSRTRRLVNVDEVARTADELGFEVLVDEASFFTKVEQFARIVNSCDVMMGVHGAGLTNIVFLPTNGVIIQIVPFGGLEGVSMLDFGEPALDMKLKYMQYSISEEESTLIEHYPRDHPVFKDPMSFHKQGWGVMGKIYLVQQNVRLNVTRFRPVLLEAVGLLAQ